MSDDAERKDSLFGVLESFVGFFDGMITRRLMKFHDALVERGQIPPIPPKEKWPMYADAAATSAAADDSEHATTIQ